ncbi:3',5'-cyclic-nucleotide phosphodiesterase pde1 [Thecaphora frezii]
MSSGPSRPGSSSRPLQQAQASFASHPQSSTYTQQPPHQSPQQQYQQQQHPHQHQHPQQQQQHLYHHHQQQQQAQQQQQQQPQQQRYPHVPSPTESFFSMDEVAYEGLRPKRQSRIHLHPPDQEASFSFVCLGTGGGPLEGDCSCYLMKPADAAWQDGSIVVEGGSWLGALTTVLEQTGPDSAFYDFDFPSTTPTSFLRAGLVASFAEAFLISHAHLDHILGLVLGSASLPGKRAVYGLQPTLENILEMFNGKIWPKLASWNEDEPYTMYHMRPLESQRPFSLNQTFSVLPFALSHGLNPSVPPAPPTPSYTPAKFTQSYFNKRASLPLSTQMASFRLARGVDERARTLDKTIGGASQLEALSSGRATETALEGERDRLPFSSPFQRTSEGQSDDSGASSGAAPKPGEPVSPRAHPLRAPSMSASSTATPSSSVSAPSPTSRSRARPSRPRTAQGSESHAPPPSAWTSTLSQLEGTHRTEANHEKSGGDNRAATTQERPPRRVPIERTPPSLDSTAFFITHSGHDRDVLFFGDVEPDCVSKSPRNRQVWGHAAQRFVEGKLNTIFLECSFARGHPVQLLYGHLSVEHLFEELKVLAIMVKRLRQRRRSSASSSPSSRYAARTNGTPAAGVSTSPSESRYYQPSLAPSPLGTSAVSASGTSNRHGELYSEAIPDEEVEGQLQGLSVVIIHVKPALFPIFAAAQDDTESATSGGSNGTGGGGEKLDPRSMPVKILDELIEEENEMGLGVRFVMAQQGMRIEC